MSGLVEVSGPLLEPISRTEAREHLRLDDDVDDSQVRSYIIAARQFVESYTKRTLVSRQLRQFYDAASLNGAYIEISATPVISVESVKYYDDAGNEYVWDEANYYVDTSSAAAKVVLKDGGVFPTELRAVNGLEINFTAGYGTSPTSVPEVIRVAVLQYMTFLYEHRGDFDTSSPVPPVVIQSLLAPYRVLRFGVEPTRKVKGLI